MSIELRFVDNNKNNVIVKKKNNNNNVDMRKTKYWHSYDEKNLVFPLLTSFNSTQNLCLYGLRLICHLILCAASNLIFINHTKTKNMWSYFFYKKKIAKVDTHKKTIM